MLSEDTVKKISYLFCGDTEGFYSYKSGPVLVNFFNQYYNAGDVYRQGFPTRWMYVYDKLVVLLNDNSINSFFDIILDKRFLVNDQGLTMVEAAEKSATIYDEINRILSRDMYKLIRKGEHYILIEENEDLVPIGHGGFADVYYQKSTGLIVKRLKDDFLADTGIRSRFKREFDITKTLQGIYGIIEVYAFDNNNYSYTMERAETTLEDYILSNDLSDEIKLNCIRQILYIMKQVHNCNIIHRDISPNNIFIVAGQLKIADFGLGKDLNVFTSHQTVHTNAMGQYYYCAPEQFMMLRDGDKRSDVYSLGRVINFIMTHDPINSHHIYGSVTEKATNADSAYRYADAGQLATFFEKSVEYHMHAENKEAIERKIQNRIYDTDVSNYIHDMTPNEISKAIRDKKLGFQEALLHFMHDSQENAQHIIQSIEESFRDVCSSFESHDPFATFANKILKDRFPFVVNEIAASILGSVAWDVNRFSAQDMVNRLIEEGIDPMIEDILKR